MAECISDVNGALAMLQAAGQKFRDGDQSAAVDIRCIVGDLALVVSVCEEAIDEYGKMVDQ